MQTLLCLINLVRARGLHIIVVIIESRNIKGCFSFWCPAVEVQHCLCRRNKESYQWDCERR